MFIVRGINVYPLAVGTVVDEFRPAVNGEFQVVLRDAPPHALAPLVRVALAEPLAGRRPGAARPVGSRTGSTSCWCSARRWSWSRPRHSPAPRRRPAGSSGPIGRAHMSDAAPLVVERVGAVVVLRLDRPHVLNALSPALVEALLEGVAAVADGWRCALPGGRGERSRVLGGRGPRGDAGDGPPGVRGVHRAPAGAQPSDAGPVDPDHRRGPRARAGRRLRTRARMRHPDRGDRCGLRVAGHGHRPEPHERDELPAAAGRRRWLGPGPVADRPLDRCRRRGADRPGDTGRGARRARGNGHGGGLGPGRPSTGRASPTSRTSSGAAPMPTSRRRCSTRNGERSPASRPTRSRLACGHSSSARSGRPARRQISLGDRTRAVAAHWIRGSTEIEIDHARP